MGGTHDASWIPQVLPGAGNLMVFNNGQYLYQRTPGSSVLEINPFLDAAGIDTYPKRRPPGEKPPAGGGRGRSQDNPAK